MTSLSRREMELTASWHGSAGRLLASIMLVGLCVSTVTAQDRASDIIDKPILILNTGAHSAPIRRLLFTPDESQLLSAGDDKVVKVWNLTGKPRLDWTIRPPIGARRAGAIFGMALSPLPDDRGQYTLALGGYGIESTRGEIGLFRFPGEANLRQGEIQKYLAHNGPIEGNDPSTRTGHIKPLTCLSFSPDGKILASSSNDGTVRLWDYQKKTQVPLIVPGQSPVNALAFTPDGQSLVTGGWDGTVRVWDLRVNPPRVIKQASPPAAEGLEKDREGLRITALGVSPDGRWLVIGREDSSLFRYDLTVPDFAKSQSPLNAKQTQGAVEGLAIGPGGLLATSIMQERKQRPEDRPKVACDIEIRQVANPGPVTLLEVSSNLVYALAFSPQGKYLAFGGGDQQQIKLVDLKQFKPQGNNPLISVSEQATRGRSLWRVGFVKNDSTKLAYWDKNTDIPPSVCNGFDLKNRSRIGDGVPASDVSLGSDKYPGWTIRPVGTYEFEVFQGQRFVEKITLDDGLDGRWWDYKFVPPGPKHEQLILAVACQYGVAIYRLGNDVVRTRFFDGHTGAVYSLAPSPDGKWLATASADQTIRLWSLANADILAPLGAVFEMKEGKLAVKSVEPNGFADLAGMMKGDVVIVGVLGDKIYSSETNLKVKADKPEDFLKFYESIPPNQAIQYNTRRPPADLQSKPIELGTLKRDKPSLSLFVGLDGEWVIWTPQGYYDSSVTGDSKFLGWQVNHYSKETPQPTTQFPIVTNQQQLRQPKDLPNNRIDQLLGTGIAVTQDATQKPDLPADVIPFLGKGNVKVVDRDNRVIQPDDPLPEIITVDAPGPLEVLWKVKPNRPEQPASFETRLEGKLIRKVEPPPYDNVQKAAMIRVVYELNEPGKITLSGHSDLGRGYERKVAFTAEVKGIPPKKPSKLHFLAIAPEFQDQKISKIEKAVEDVEELTNFFPRYLVNRSGERFVKSMNSVGIQLDGEDAKAQDVVSAAESLRNLKPEPGDMLVVVVETYILNYGGNENRKGQLVEPHLVVSDSRDVPISKKTTVSTDDLSNALAELVNVGCRVMVVLDGTHDSSGCGVESRSDEWARLLYQKCGVITVVATRGRPSKLKFVNQNRPLADAILKSIQAANLAGTQSTMSLYDFRSEILRVVKKSTQGYDSPEVFIPDTIFSASPILGR